MYLATKLTEILSGGEETVTEPTEEIPSEGITSIPTPGPPRGSSASGIGGGLPLREEAPNATRILTLDVFGICSGKTNINAQFFETSESCIVKDILPYYVILEKNNDFIKTSFYEGIGFNETYNMTDYVAIFRLFAKDISTIDEDVKVVKAYGPMTEYFD